MSPSCLPLQSRQWHGSMESRTWGGWFLCALIFDLQQDSLQIPIQLHLRIASKMPFNDVSVPPHLDFSGCRFFFFLVCVTLGWGLVLNILQSAHTSANSSQACRRIMASPYIKSVTFNGALDSLLRPRDLLRSLVYQPFVQQSAVKC